MIGLSRESIFVDLANNSLSMVIMVLFFSVRIFIHGHLQFKGLQGKGEEHLHSSLPLLPTHEHFQTFRYSNHVFLFTSLVTTTLLQLIRFTVLEIINLSCPQKKTNLVIPIPSICKNEQ